MDSRPETRFIHALGKHHRPTSSLDGLSHSNIYSHLLQSDVVTIRFSLLTESAKSIPECEVAKHSRSDAHWEIGLNVLPLAVPRYPTSFARKVYALGITPAFDVPQAAVGSKSLRPMRIDVESRTVRFAGSLAVVTW